MVLNLKNSQIILLVICMILLFFRYYTNLGHETHLFKNFQKDGEALVIGKLAFAKRNSVFYKGGFLGAYGGWPSTPYLKNLQFQVLNKPDLQIAEDFKFYNSQIGAQGIFYALLNSASPFEQKRNLKLFHFITSFLTALSFTGFLYWVLKKFGFIATCVTFIGIFLSTWIAYFGRNLFWNIWAFYIAFLVLLFYLETHKRISFKKLFLIAMSGLFIKCCINGYEFITTALVLSTLPIFFYGYLNGYAVKDFIKRFLTISIGAISGVILSMLVLTLQMSFLSGSLKSGVNHIIYSFKKRAYSNENFDFDRVLKDAQESNLSSVILTYLQGTAFSFKGILPFLKDSIATITYLELSSFFLISAVLLFVITHYTKLNLRLNRALLIFFLISILAPLSWIVIFKAHSYIHTGMNKLIWYMPYVLLGFLVVGQLFNMIIQFFRSRILRLKITN